jgi:isopenicillin N synthase-like dioxygenase
MSDVRTPDVRGEIRDDADTLFLMDHPDSMEEIPTLDLGPYLEGAAAGREKVAAELRHISTTVGFFQLINHGIPQPVLDEVFKQSRRFHTLPLEEKMKVPQIKVDGFFSGYQAGSGQRGRSNVNIIRDAKPNLYSRFSVNPEREAAGLSKAAPSANPKLWPDNLPGFREAVQDYHSRVEALGRQFLPLWATTLGLELAYFDRFFATPHLTMSLLHYPPQKEVGNKQYGIAPHTDNSLMTFLATSDVSGLAVRMPSGHWRLVETLPGALVVNTGNLMVRWTNGEFLSTKHRVINTNTVDRYSIPTFFGPSGDALIECVPTCQGPDRPARYPPITYSDLRNWYYTGGN